MTKLEEKRRYVEAEQAAIFQQMHDLPPDRQQLLVDYCHNRLRLLEWHEKDARIALAIQLLRENTPKPLFEDAVRIVFRRDPALLRAHRAVCSQRDDRCESCTAHALLDPALGIEVHSNALSPAVHALKRDIDGV